MQDLSSVLKRLLCETANFDLVFTGFPSDWGEAELHVFLVPLGCCQHLELKKAEGSDACFVTLRPGTDSTEIKQRLLSSRLKGLLVEQTGKPTKTGEDDQQPKVTSGSERFTVGQHMLLQNLKTQTELNGQRCVIKGFDEESSHWLVQMDDSPDELLVAATNLSPLKEETKSRDADVSKTEEEEQGKKSQDQASPSAAATETKGGDSTKPLRILHVTGLPEQWSQSRIEEYFARHGELRCVRLAKTVQKGQRSALIAFRRPANAKSALPRVNGADVDGNKLKAELRADPEKKEPMTNTADDTTQKPKGVAKRKSDGPNEDEPPKSSAREE